MMRRARMLSVLGLLLIGGIGIISSTQTWLVVARTDAAEPLLVAGSEAMPLLAPLALAVLALGAALSIAGLVLRVLFAVLAAAASVVLTVGTSALLFGMPLNAAASAVADATGLSGDDALQEIVASIQPTAWPPIALTAWVFLLLVAVYVLVTAKSWKSGGRKYRAASEAQHHDAGPLDAVDSWDELSQGTDPTDTAR